MYVRVHRQEPTTQQTVKRTWTKASITNESSLKPPMPETKKHKVSSDITEEVPPSLVQESMVMPPPPVRATQTEDNNAVKVREGTQNTTQLTDKEVTQILNTSDKENESLDIKNKLSSEQVHKKCYNTYIDV